MGKLKLYDDQQSSFHMFVDKGTCLTAIDDDTVQQLYNNQLKNMNEY